MKPITIIIEMLISVCCILLLLSVAVAEERIGETKGKRDDFCKEKPDADIPSDHPQGKATEPIVGSEEKKHATRIDMPVYKPPFRGAPRGRVGGGTRGGPDDKPPSLCVIAPDHVGLTVKEQPCFYWFISGLARHPIEFTLIEDFAIHPLIEKRIPSPKQPGIQRTCLAEYGVRLLRGKTYKWYVVLIPDPERRSKDIISGGTIECIENPKALDKSLVRAGKAGATQIYAQAGIWYDAFSEISSLIETMPKDIVLQKQRASLLEQADLPVVARYEIEKIGAGGP